MDEEKDPKNLDEKWQAYGNNYFYLTVAVNKKYYHLEAVMQEIPTVNFTSEWEDSPSATLGDTIDNFINSEFLEFINQRIGESEYRHFGLAGGLTSRVFKNGSKPSFSLKFRCYSGQKIGPCVLSSAKTWMCLLALTTPINSKNVIVSASDFAADMLKNVASSGAALYNYLSDLVKGDDSNDDKVEIKEIFDKETNRMKLDDEIKFNEDEKKKLKKAFEDESLKDKTKKDEETSKKVINLTENLLSGEDSKNDIANNTTDTNKMNNASIYGANIFHLRILPFIFKKPFTVIIKSWSVTPSREWNYTTNDHYYYDFSINTEMDITPSCETMMSLMY